MPFDQYFASKPKRPKPEESVEMQIGRSDYLLGVPISSPAFPHAKTKQCDAAEWNQGWLAERLTDINRRKAGELANPPWRSFRNKNKIPTS